MNSENELGSIEQPIDAVVIWVDGNDPVHFAKRMKYGDHLDQNTMECGALEGRFIDAGEIKYCIYSIRKFAPWIRNIFLVTDDQRPLWLSNEFQDKFNVFIVDHKIIFKDHLSFLPTFNNLSIISLVWNIPGLANDFILFNDDTFLIKDTILEDFFSKSKIVLRGNWKKQNPGIIKKIKKILKHIIFKRNIAQIKIIKDHIHINGARLAGFYRDFFETLHCPLPMKVDVQREFYRKNPEILQNNVKYKFRNYKQFGPGVLCNHLAFKSNSVIEVSGRDVLVIIPKQGGLKDNRNKLEILKDRNQIKFLCFQDMAYLKQQNPAEFEEVISYLDKTIIF